MKRKLTSYVLAIVVTVSLCVPTLAADRGDTIDNTCPNELLWQLLLRGCCGCDNGQEGAQNDWSALLRAWLTQPGTPGQNAAPQTEKPTQSDTPTQPSKPTQSDTPTQPDKPTQSDKPSQSETPSRPTASSAYEQEVIRLVNVEREKAGLAPLTESAPLTRTARMKSQDMHDLSYFDHQSPTYGSPFDLMKSQGIRYRTAGENIAMGYRTPEAVVSAWMNSSGHRANILNASYTSIGVGYVASGNYWTQHFTG